MKISFLDFKKAMIDKLEVETVSLIQNQRFIVNIILNV